MSQWIINSTPDRIRGNTSWTEYTNEEIVAAWSEEGQGHRQAVKRGYWCVIVDCDEYDAISLSRLFIRNVFAIPTCCHYDRETETLSLYCLDAGSQARGCFESTECLVAFWPHRRGEDPKSCCGYKPSEHAGRGECP